jgi:sporulation protein YlmC with PRC-barrel domain
MKKILVGIAALIVATPLVAGAQATRPADRPASDRDTTTKQRDTQRDTRPAWRNDAGLHESSDIIGTRIKNAEGKDIGEIDRLMIDPQSGKISHVVVGLGGFLGVGEKKVVVPWSDLKMTGHADGRKAVITMDQAKLESAPRYERTARADRSPSASPATDRSRSTSPAVTSPTRDTDKDGKRDSADKAPADPTKK